jgi:hypothetical protein
MMHVANRARQIENGEPMSAPIAYGRALARAAAEQGERSYNQIFSLST